MKLFQQSFSAGELSPGLNARTDIDKYAIGLAKMRNFYVDFKGGATRRPGTRFVGRTRSSNQNVILIPFTFSVEQSYMLEFGNQYMRVIKDGGFVLEASKTITGVTQANPGVVTSAGHGFANGDRVYIDGVSGMTQVNGRIFRVAGAAANTFQLVDDDAANINTSGYGAYTSGGTASRVYTLTTPYAHADLPKLKYTQTADVMTLTHPSYAPMDLSRTAHDAWTLTTITFGSALAAPAAPVITTNFTAGTTEYSYVVTAVDANGDESLASAAGTITANNWQTEPTKSNSVDWAAVVGAVSYNVYRAASPPNRALSAGAIHGYIGSAAGTRFIDFNIAPDFTTTAPTAQNPFSMANRYPGASEYYQQRRVFARSNAFPQTFWMTQTGLFRNLNVSSPVKEADAITGTLVGRQVNEIKHLIAMPKGLVALTGGSVFRIGSSGESSAITPADLQAQPQIYGGASDVRPILVGHEILYIQSRGSVVRNLAYNFTADNFIGQDITALANHLILGKQIVSWTFAEEPWKLCWAVRNDGVLLAMTYMPEQKIAGWSWHDTYGEFKWVASVVEGQEDVTYFVTKRKVGGDWVQMIERLAGRVMKQGIESGWFVDSGAFRGPASPGASLRMTEANGTTTLIASSGIFSGADVGKVIRAGGGRVLVTAHNSSTNLTGTVQEKITDVDGEGKPVEFEEGEWTMGSTFSTVTGLWHLEGRADVVGLVDGEVVGPLTVANGSVTLPEPASLAVIGLPFTSQLQTLKIDSGDPTIQGEMKKNSVMIVRLYESRKLRFGYNFSDMYDMKEAVESIPQTGLYNRDIEVFLPSSWDRDGQIALEITDPYAATVLGIIPETFVGKIEGGDERRSAGGARES